MRKSGACVSPPRVQRERERERGAKQKTLIFLKKIIDVFGCTGS